MEFVNTILSVWKVLDSDERSVSLDDVSCTNALFSFSGNRYYFDMTQGLNNYGSSVFCHKFVLPISPVNH